MKILIMAGGSGERFWPLSTKENPKQLLSLVSDKSMIRETVDRVLNFVDISDVFVATNQMQVPGIIRELPDLPIRNIIIEPAFRDTAAAIAYGSTVISKYEDNPVIAVLASDHLIKDEQAFVEVVKLANNEAKKGKIITLGVKPTRAETGYGYIKLSDTTIGVPQDVVRFLEKPNYDTALDYIKSKEYVWNSGMFIFQYNVIMNELNKFLPNHIEVINILDEYISNNSGSELCELVKPYFNKFERISIDFAVMEKSHLIKCIPVDFGWNDIGGYISLEDIFDKDSSNNVFKDCKYIYLDSNDNIVLSSVKDKLITTLGVSNMIIVNTKDELLICNKSDSQRIKELLEEVRRH